MTHTRHEYVLKIEATDKGELYIAEFGVATYAGSRRLRFEATASGRSYVSERHAMANLRRNGRKRRLYPFVSPSKAVA